MASRPGILHSSTPCSENYSIIFGNGQSLPVSFTGFSSVPTSAAPPRLNSALISDSIVKNLISVRKLTRDNSVSVEFDPFGLSIKDLRTRKVILRCDSTGDLYQLCPPSAFSFHATTATRDLWHQRLGNPSTDSCNSILSSFDFHCNKLQSHICSACQLGKQARLPFTSSASRTFFPFQLIH
jgi:hypothetical protein